MPQPILALAAPPKSIGRLLDEALPIALRAIVALAEQFQAFGADHEDRHTGTLC